MRYNCISCDQTWDSPVWVDHCPACGSTFVQQAYNPKPARITNSTGTEPINVPETKIIFQE